MPPNPEQLTRKTIDPMLNASGWAVQDDKASDVVARANISSTEVETIPIGDLAHESILQKAFTGNL